MTKGSLFEYAVIYHPEVEKDKKPKKSEILVDITRIVAGSEDEVAIIAARGIPAAHLDHLNEVEIAIRPF